MKQLFTMIKMLMNTGAGWSSKGDNKNKKKTNNIVVIMFLVFIVIPLAFALGFISFYMTFLLQGTGKEAYVLQFGIGIAGMTMLFFGAIMVPSVFYYSDDLQYLLPMPIKPMNIINSKFFTTYIWENLTSIFIFVPIMIGYAIGKKVDLLFWLFGIVVLITLSIIPMLYGIIANILLIRFTSFGKNKNFFSYFVSITSLLLSVFISVYLLNNLYSGNGNIFYTLAISSNSLAAILSKIFPFLPYASNTMAYGSIKDLLIYLGMVIGFFVVYLIIAKLFYYKGLLKMTNGNKQSKPLSKEKIIKKSKQKSQFMTLVKKEFTNLFMNPSYFSGCIGQNFLLSVMLFLLPSTSLWPTLISFLNSTYHIKMNCYLMTGILSLAFLSSGMNYISSTAISREGNDYQAMKYMPIDYGIQVFAKIFTASISSIIAFTVSFIIFAINLSIDIEILIFGYIVGVIICVAMSEIGLLIDLYNPNLLWDDEQKAVKQNFNGMMHFLMSLVFAFLLGFLLIKLCDYYWTVLFIFLLFVILIFGFLGIYLYHYSEKYFKKF